MANATSQLDTTSLIEATATRRHRAANWPVLLGTLVFLTVSVASAYFLREYQVARTAEIYKDRSAQLEAEGDTRTAIQYLFRYTKFRPFDGAARAKLASLYGESANNYQQKQRAIELCREALGFVAAEEKLPVRQNLAEFLLENNRLVEAEQEAALILGEDPQDAVGLRVFAVAKYRQYKTPVGEFQIRDKGDVGKSLEAAWSANPGHVGLGVILADVLRNDPDLLPDGESIDMEQCAARADRVMEALVKNDLGNPVPHLVRYEYQRRYGLQGAEQSLQEAFRLGPDVELVRLAQANALRRQADQLRQAGQDGLQRAEALYVEAATHLEYITSKINAHSEVAYVAHGDLLADQGKSREAVQRWQVGLQKIEDSVTLALRIADILVRENKPQAVQAMAQVDELLIERGPFLSTEVRDSLRRTRGLMQGLWWIQQRDIEQAEAQLKPIVNGAYGVGVQRDDAIRAVLLLGRAYRDQRNFEQAAQAYEQAVDMTPNNDRYRVLAANAHLTNNEVDEALMHLRIAAPNLVDPDVCYLLVQAELRGALRAPFAKRDWRRCQAALKSAQAVLKKTNWDRPWRMDLLEVEIDLQSTPQADSAAGKQKVLSKLELLEQAYDRDVELLTGLARLYERLADSAAADRCLARIEQIATRPSTPYLLRADLLLKRDDRAAAKQVLDDGLKKVSGDDARALQNALIQLQRLDGNLAPLRALLATRHEQDRNDPEPIFQLWELDLRQGNLSLAEQWEQKISALEQVPSRRYRYLRILRLVAQASGPKDAMVELAEAEVQLLRQRYPKWALTHFAAGLTHDVRGEVERAASCYQQAIKLGDQRLVTYERLDRDLRQLGRDEQADLYLTQLGDRVYESPRLYGSDIQDAIQQDDLPTALAMAHQAVRTNGKDLIARLWLGQVLLLAENFEEAHGAFQEAKQLAPRDPRIWNGLFNYYLRTERRDEARALLDQMPGQVDLPPAELALSLAQGYQLLGVEARAEEMIALADTEGSQNYDVQMKIAEFYLPRDRAKSRVALDNARRLRPGSVEANLRSMQQLIDLGNAESEARIQGLRQDMAAAGDSEAAEVFDRAVAAMLAIRQTQDRVASLERARKLVEGLLEDTTTPKDADRILLALIYSELSRVQAKTTERRKFIALADEQFRKVLEGNSKPSPLHLLSYVSFLLEQGHHDTAESWLDQLDNVAPQTMSTVSLRARWLHAAGQDDAIVPLVEGVAQRLVKELKTEERVQQFCERVGELYTSVQQYGAAQAWYRRLALDRGQRYVRLADLLARQGKVNEAVKICFEAAASDHSSRPMITLLRVVNQDIGAVTPQIDAEIQKSIDLHPQDFELAIGVANLRLQQQRSTEAIAIYERMDRLIGQKPEEFSNGIKVMVWNNLATLLADEADRPDEALSKIEDAIRLEGARAALLDTKGAILLRLSKFEQALEPLETAVHASINVDPRYRFHYAIALHQTGQRSQAEEQLRRSLEEGLLDSVLTASDRESLDRLRQAFPDIEVSS